jgi:lipoate-protein ligase B
MSRAGLLVELGQVEYLRALELQRRVHELRLAGEIPDTLILLEHPPVITFGKSASRGNLRATEAELGRRGIRVERVERGGDVTFHGPGQLVGYPIFHLREGLVGVRAYVEGIESALVAALARLGLVAGTREGYVGVWVGGRKIASIGVAVGRGVTLHGFALNVSTDLSYFELIEPCGIAGVKMTSVAAERGDADAAAVRRAVVAGFEREFGLELQRNLPRSLTSLTSGLSC